MPYFPYGPIHKQQAIETVTPMMDADGIWRVSGYYLR